MGLIAGASHAVIRWGGVAKEVARGALSQLGLSRPLIVDPDKTAYARRPCQQPSRDVLDHALRRCRWALLMRCQKDPTDTCWMPALPPSRG